MVGPDRLHEVPDALASAPWADAHVVVWTGACQPPVVDGAVVVHRTWPGRFDRARTIAIQAGWDGFDLLYPADWVVILDSDERLVGDPRAELSQLAADGVHVADARHISGRHGTTRAVHRDAPSLRYVGRTHEALDLTGLTRRVLTSLRFDELARTPEQTRAKCQRDLELLREELAEHPQDARWWYYQGQTLSCLGELAQAEACFERASELTRWDEQGAWSRYSAARCALQLGCLERALVHCVRGLCHDPGFAEIHWLAGVVALQSHRPQAALAWAMQARLWGSHEGHATQAGRLSHAEPEAAWEGPYRVLEQAYRELGRDAEADEAGRLAVDAGRRGA